MALGWGQWGRSLPEHLYRSVKSDYYFPFMTSMDGMDASTKPGTHYSRVRITCQEREKTMLMLYSIYNVVHFN